AIYIFRALKCDICESWVAYSFFFSSRRRHTRFSRDWSSDVCSSDLDTAAGHLLAAAVRARGIAVETGANTRAIQGDGRVTGVTRSEERRVGKECRSRWSQ